MPSSPTRSMIEQALFRLLTPNGADIVSAGWVSGFVIRGGKIGFALDIPEDAGISFTEAEQLRSQAEAAVRTLPGVEQVTVALTGHLPPEGQVRIGKRQEEPKAVTPPTPKPLPGVKRIIAVASGKGGVGKSTVAVNLAVALAKIGLKVGIVDADIYGPSLARMLGIKEKPEIVDNQMIPPERYGVKAMSMGMLLDEDTPTVWRGPMVSKALSQLFRGAAWGALDVLVIDMPPGTGDVHLSIAQNFMVSGTVMVTTPQEVALMDVKKAIAMFQKMQIPILGLVENMSYFDEPKSGTRNYLFGKNGGRLLADKLSLSLLGEIPIQPEITQGGDAGTPFANEAGPLQDTMLAIAKQVGILH